FSPLRTPTEKHAKEQNTLLSVPDQDWTLDHLARSPGTIKAAHCFWLPLRKDSSGWVKGQISLSTSSACVCVCVCPVSPPNARVCCCVSCCVAKKNKHFERLYLI